MANIFRVQYKFNYHWAMASAILATLPMGILFATLQKQFISGLTLGGLKG
jgi:ABC-type maltose transport system permease subunit